MAAPLIVSSDRKTLGESKRGKQKKLTVPSLHTRAVVRRLPITPWDSMSG